MAEARRMLRHCHDGLRRRVVLVVGVVVIVAALLGVVGIMEAVELRYEKSLFDEHRDFIEADALRKAGS